MLKAIHAMESMASSQEKAAQIVQRLRELKLPKAAKVLEQGIDESLSYHHYPLEHHRSLRTNNMLERIMREIRRRTRVVGAFPDGESALMLVSARLRHIESKSWSDSRVYLDMSKLRDADQEREVAKRGKIG